MSQRMPIVVVLGATACGKSRLAIELAKKFRGEIISADSMQVYKGLDIVTNKVTEEEQQQAKHHMIDFIDPMNRYSVIDFRNKALDIIDSLHNDKKLPIIVGGTNYYIESLLWKSFILGPTNLDSTKRTFDNPTGANHQETIIDLEYKELGEQTRTNIHTDEDFEDVDKFFSKPIYNEAFTKVPSEKLWHILELVDQTSAHLFHPNDKRRIIRCLQLIQAKKKNYSELLKDINKSSEDRSSLGGPLRYEACLVLWIDCDYTILDEILNKRVEKMLNHGLLSELEEFHDEYNKKRIAENKWPEYDKGVFQTIGFKEFHEYFMLAPDERASKQGNQVLKAAIERMKISTRQYARRQVKWVRRRFLQLGTRDLPPVFRLHAAFDETGWMDQVQKPAFDIVTCFLEGAEYPENLCATYLKKPEQYESVNNPGKYYCEVCDKILIGSNTIKAHLESKVHERKVKSEKFKKQKISENDLSCHTNEKKVQDNSKPTDVNSQLHNKHNS